MNETKTNVLLLMLMGIVILLMVTIIGLFIRMNQLQNNVVAALEFLGAVSEPPGLEKGTKAPEFSLPDVRGQTVTLGDFAGQGVLLVFSSTRCPACAELSPNLKTFSEEMDEMQVVMISRGSVEENQQLVEEQGFGFPVLIWDDGVARDYKVPGTPFLYVINESGVVVSRGFANSLGQLKKLAEVE